MCVFKRQNAHLKETWSFKIQTYFIFYCTVHFIINELYTALKHLTDELVMYPNGEPQVQSLVLIFFSSLKRQCMTFIIVRFKVVQDWPVKLYWCYFISHFGACESFSRKSCTTMDECTKTWTEKNVQTAWNALKWTLTAEVMLDVIPSPQGRLLLTRSALCCVSKVTACKWQSCIRHRTLTLIYKVRFYLAWFTPRLCVIIYFNDGDEWVLVALQARLGRLSALALEKKVN